MKRPDGTTMPTAAVLASRINDELGLSAASSDLATIAQLAELRHGRARLVAIVQDALSGFEPGEPLVQLARIPWGAIFTTNYDPGIVRAFALCANPARKPVVVAQASDLASVDKRFDVGIFFVHGNLFTGHPEDILITRSDYDLFSRSRRMLFDNLRVRFADSTFVYIGYGNEDFDWSILQSDIQAEFANAPLPHAYRIAPSTDPIEVELLEARGISTLEGTLEDFATATARIDFGQGTEAPSGVDIPPSLRSAFEAAPAATLRFLNSWEVCNDADFEQRPNTAGFLRGDRPNWGVISSGLSFPRDTLTDIYDHVIDYATRKDAQRYVGAVLAPAGYGVSTLLMQLAYRLISERVGLVFRLKPGANLIEADVLFITTFHEGARHVFILDNASAVKTSVRSILQLLNQEKLTAYFLLGSRLNEWRSTPGFVSATEFFIDPLSNAEITSLLTLLGDTGELGDLQHFTPEQRFELVKHRSQKELLVILREVTEGKQFDAIIEDEFRNIRDSDALRFYSLVCGLWQEGHYLREAVAADVLSMGTDELFKLIDGALNGVVFHDTLNEAEGIYGFRARHRTIARIVWYRCIAPEERERLMIDLMRRLNLIDPIDKAAFSALIQSDELVDSMPSLEGRIIYFETATGSDPRNPYVLQHFARMYLRADRLHSALTQIEHALTQNQHIRALHHTHGVILSRITRTTHSSDAARRFMAQAEEEFRYCITAESRDEYSYQSLAELYREWADRAEDIEESLAYLRKAEETVADGLRKTRVHDRLHIESAKIAESLGNKPEKLQSLKRAVDSNTASVVARYLYGRALRQNGDFNEAIKVLEPIFLEDSESFRAAIELALCKVLATGDFAIGVAILKQASLFGERDAAFVSTLGGMQFLAKQLDDAKATFQKGRALPAEEQRPVRYRPETRVGEMIFGPVELRGSISTVHAGFAFASVPGYLDIFLGTSSLNGKRLSPGDNVTFAVIFNAIGPIGDVTSLRA